MRQRSVSVIVSVGVVVSVLTGVVGSASASVGSGDRPVFVPVVPCRLLDTRPSSAVGVRTSPLGPGDTWVQPVSGVNGNCTLPSSIAAVVLNVTALNGSAASFLTVFPDGVERPRTSNVNWLAGGAPRPNQVGVAVSTTGRISLYNEAGTVDVIADVVGYYQAHSHGDRFAPRAELDAALPAQGVVRVGASEFVPAASDAVLGRDDTCVNLASTGASESYLLHASVPLPVGAHVTGVTASLIDAAPSAIEFDLMRRTLDELTTVGSGTTAGTPSAEATVAIVVDEVVDHDEYFSASVRFAPTPQPTDHEVCGFEVSYDYAGDEPAVDDAVFVPIVPCRLLDTRVPGTVGLRNTPLQARETLVVPVTGADPQGTCAVAPPDAVAVSLNVTAVGGSAASYLTIWPGGSERPLVSSLNWEPGAPPTPNKVDVGLSESGAIGLYNEAGTVDVIADVLGYYVPHDHDADAMTRREVDVRQPWSGGSVVIAGPAFDVAGSYVQDRRSIVAGCAATDYYRPVRSSNALTASVLLPVGATITGFRVLANRGQTDLSVWLTRSAAGEFDHTVGDSGRDPTPVGTSGTHQLFDVELAIPEVVDPGETFSVSVGASVSYPAAPDACGAEVFYEPPTAAVAPDPAPSGVFVPIEPCRLADTRASSVVGSRTTPLAAADTHVVQVTGASGSCDVAEDAIAVAMNVTAVGGTAASFLTIWPGGDRPLVSSLNWLRGAPPTPNKVDVRLSGTGSVSMYNHAGTVDVVADVVGFYTNHDHDDRYVTAADVPLRFTDTRTLALSSWAYGVDGEALEYGSGCRTVIGVAATPMVLVASLPVPADVTLESVAVTVVDGTAIGDVVVDLVASPRWGPSSVIDSVATGVADAAGVRTVELDAASTTVESGTTYAVRTTLSAGGSDLGVCGASFTYD